jgi:Predicted membrane protein (DUF2243)
VRGSGVSWRRRGGAARELLAGWGVFNVVEGLIDHQLLNIHHLRDDSARRWGGPLERGGEADLGGAGLGLFGRSTVRQRRSADIREQRLADAVSPQRSFSTSRMQPPARRATPAPAGRPAATGEQAARTGCLSRAVGAGGRRALLRCSP